MYGFVEYVFGWVSGVCVFQGWVFARNDGLWSEPLEWVSVSVILVLLIRALDSSSAKSIYSGGL